MTKYDQILAIAKENNGVFTGKMVRNSGISSVYISNLLKRKQISKIASGVYVYHFADEDEMYFFQLRHPRAIYSFSSALWLHGLTEEIPEFLEITLPKGYNPSRLAKQKVMTHFSSENFYPIGQKKLQNEFGNSVIAYDAERTLCDITRNRKSTDSEVFGKAFKMYQMKPDRDFQKLREYAKIFHILPEIEKILEIL